jgi:hypothetical protein
MTTASQLSGNINLTIPQNQFSFRVLCYTQLNSRSSLVVLKSPAQISLSRACNNLTYSTPLKLTVVVGVSFEFSTLLIGELSPQITVTLSGAPATGIFYAKPTISYLGSLCDVSSNISFVNQVQSFANVAPNLITIHANSAGVFYVQPLLEGC